MKSVVLSLLLLVLSTVSAYAKCYTKKEVEAEQGIRIHSELMVISLNCQHLWPKNERNLYLQYKDFTKKHEKVFAGYERVLLNFYRAEGKASPERHMHEVRTDFANKISEDAAKMRPDAFCKVYAPRIGKAAKMTEERLRQWAGTVFPGHPVSRPLCAKN